MTYDFAEPEPFSDEELASHEAMSLPGGARNASRYELLMWCARLAMTVIRLRAERAEARRVARVLATAWSTYLATGNPWVPAPEVDTALAYPDTEPKQET